MSIMSQSKTISVGTRGLSITAAGLGGFLTLMFLIHTNFVIPSVIHEARKEMQSMLDIHGRQPHEGAVREEQFDDVLRIMQNQLDRIEEKVDNIRGQ